MKSHGLFGAYSPFNFFCNLYKSVSSPIVTHPSCNSPNGPENKKKNFLSLFLCAKYKAGYLFQVSNFHTHHSRP